MTTPTRAPLMPEPFGYVSDGFPDGLHFQHKPWPELHQLTHSVAAVYSAAQLVQAIEDAKAAGREQGLRELGAMFDQPHMEYFGDQIAAAIEQLRK